MTQSFVTNPLTGRLIKIGGTVFNQLVFEAYDFINGELIRRDSAPPIPPREYYYNIITRRRVLSGSKRYHDLLNDNWNIECDYYLIPPWININTMPEQSRRTDILPEMRQSVASSSANHRQSDRSITYEQIMNRHRDTLNNLNITLCKECFIPIRKIEDTTKDYCNECRSE
jgi:hypothetical protein